MINEIKRLESTLLETDAATLQLRALRESPSPWSQDVIRAVDRTRWSIDYARNGVVLAAEEFLTLHGPVISIIASERQRQDEEWGGPTHDDEHTLADWVGFIDYQTTKFDMEGDNDNPERLVKIAALAIAALEAHQRRHA